MSGLATMDSKACGKMGVITITYYLWTTFMAVTVGIILVVSIHPGAAAQKDNYSVGKVVLSSADALLDLIRYVTGVQREPGCGWHFTDGIFPQGIEFPGDTESSGETGELGNGRTVGNGDQAPVPPSPATRGPFLPTHVPLATLSPPPVALLPEPPTKRDAAAENRFKFPTKPSGSPSAAQPGHAKPCSSLGFAR